MPPGLSCRDGLAEAKACRERHYAPYLARSPGGHDFRCPVPEHTDHKASLSINPGSKGMWMVWCCHGFCTAEDVRDALDSLGIECLGKYGLPKRPYQPGSPARGDADPAAIADAKRWHATQKLPADLNGQLLRMCIQAISEGDGDLPGDPARLLPITCPEFVALAKRAGVERSYRYRLFEKRMAPGF